MRIPVQSAPVLRAGTAPLQQTAGIQPSGDNTQCCGTNCMTKYCFFGLSSKGCSNGQPYVNCIG